MRTALDGMQGSASSMGERIPFPTRMPKRKSPKARHLGESNPSSLEHCPRLGHQSGPGMLVCRPPEMQREWECGSSKHAFGNARKECASHEPKENHAAGRCLHCPLRCLEALAYHWQSGRKPTSARHAPAVKSVRAFDRHAEPRSNAPTPRRRRGQHGGTAMRRGRPALHGAKGVDRLPQPPSTPIQNWQRLYHSSSEL